MLTKNVEGAFQHLLTDLFAFIATAVAGLVHSRSAAHALSKLALFPSA